MRRMCAWSMPRGICRRPDATRRPNTAPRIFRAPSSSTSTIFPTRKVRCRTCWRRRRNSRAACASWAWATAISSWPMTAPASIPRRAPGGCCAPWGMKTWSCSTAGSRSGSARAAPSTTWSRCRSRGISRRGRTSPLHAISTRCWRRRKTAASRSSMRAAPTVSQGANRNRVPVCGRVTCRAASTFRIRS